MTRNSIDCKFVANKTMSLRSDLEAISPAKLIDALSIQIYEPPLCAVRDRLHDVAEALRIPILVIDFDTEVCMNGMLGFLENSAGLFFNETIDAFEKLGAHKTASVLRRIAKTLERNVISTARLRADFAGTDAFQVSTFQELHGDLGAMSSEVEEYTRQLYLNTDPNTSEPVWSLLEAFLEKNRDACLDEIERLAG